MGPMVNFRKSTSLLPVLTLMFLSPMLHAETYSYDPVGRLVSVVYDDGSIIAYSYDRMGSVTRKQASQSSDPDGDGISNFVDNCPFKRNAGQFDKDQDGQGNACDVDDDNDGVVDSMDAFPLNDRESTDTDNDGIGNNADTDDDNDGLSDVDELNLYGTDPLNSDTDGDGVADGDEVDRGYDPNDPTDCRDGGCQRRSFLLRMIEIIKAIGEDG